MNESHKKKLISFITLIVILLFTSYLRTYSIIDPGSISNGNKFDYIQHNPIEIGLDADFSVFPGAGTQEDPYLIEGYNITTLDAFGIYIHYTTKHFLIRNCYIDAFCNSILIEYAAKGTVRIENNICSNNDWESGKGIVVYVSDEVSIIDNICSNNGASGIQLVFCPDSYVIRNACSNNGRTGIVLAFVDESWIIENFCDINGQNGIYVGGSELAYIGENDISRNREEGIFMEEDTSCTVINNTIEGNKIRGIKLLKTSSSVIYLNIIRDNEERGVYLDENSEKNLIYYNDFFNNSREGFSQGRDEGNLNYWYYRVEEIGNYWDNLNGNSKYEIDGNSKALDIYPQSEPSNIIIIKNDETNQTRIELLTYILSLVFSLNMIKGKNRWIIFRIP